MRGGYDLFILAHHSQSSVGPVTGSKIQSVPSKKRERESRVEFCWFTAEVIETCKQCEVHWSLENPCKSRLFEVPILARCLHGAARINLDFCMYGEEFRKPTTIFTDFSPFAKLHIQCCHKKHGVVLRGSEVVAVQGKRQSVPRTTEQGHILIDFVNYGLKFWSRSYHVQIVIQMHMWGNVSKSYAQKQRQDEIQRNRYKPLLKPTLTSNLSKQASQNPKRQLLSAKTVSEQCLKRDADGKSNRRKLTGSASSASSIRSSLPRHRQLKALRVQDATLVKYKGCVEKFLDTAAQRRWSVRNVILADKHMSEYFAELCEEGCTYNLASYTLFGYLMLQTDEPTADQNLFPQSRAALKGWSPRFPQCSRTGADPLIWFLLANQIADHNPMAAAALLIQLDSYARPSEILNVKKRDVMASTSKTCKYWGTIFGNSEFGEFTKAKQQDDTVLLDSLDRTYAPKL